MSMPESFINKEASKLFCDIRSLILEGKLKDEIKLGRNGFPRITKSGVISTAPNFPKSKDGNLFIRGTGENANDKPIVVNVVHMYRQSFWCKGKFIVDLLNQKDYC